jgi:hypothetical protein
MIAWPVTVFGADVTIGVDATYVHDTNFYRTEDNEDSADSIEPAGSIEIDHAGDRASYKAKYRGSYQKYDDNDQDDSGGAEHRFRLRGKYAFDRLTSVQVNNNFREIRNLRFTQDDIRDGDTGQDPRDNRYTRNDLELVLHRDLTRTWELDATAHHQFIDYNRNVDRSDSDSFGAGVRVLHRLAPRHRLGGGVSWVKQDFDGDDFRLDAEAEYLVADLAWVFDVAEEVQLTVHGGPAWVDTDEDSTDFVQQTEFVGGTLEGDVFRANVRSCGFDPDSGTGIASKCDANTAGAEPIPASGLGATQTYALEDGGSPVDDDETTFFGGAALEGRFADWTVDTEVLRRQSAPSGDAIAAKFTQFRWDVGYAPPLGTWNTYFAGSVERRETFSNSTLIDYVVIPGAEEAALRDEAFARQRDSDDRRDAFTALVGVRKQFTRNLSGDVAATFRHTERKVDGRTSESDTWFFSVTVSYFFDSFRL